MNSLGESVYHNQDYGIWNEGRPTIKYNKMYSHTLSEIGNGCRSPYVAWFVGFIYWQITHWRMNSTTSLRIPSQKTFSCNLPNFLWISLCPIIREAWNSFNNSCLKGESQGIKSLPLQKEHKEIKEQWCCVPVVEMIHCVQIALSSL